MRRAIYIGLTSESGGNFISYGMTGWASNNATRSFYVFHCDDEDSNKKNEWYVLKKNLYFPKAAHGECLTY